MQANDLLRFAADVCDRLQLTYFVTGSTATIAYGEPRLTADIDIVLDLPSASVEAFCRAFPADEFYLNPHTVQTAVLKGTQFNVIHPASGLKIDFMVLTDTDFNRSRASRKLQLPVLENRVVSFASPEDAIIMKLDYYQKGRSEKHLRDIGGVLRVQGQIIDRRYIEEWATRLGVLDVWTMILEREASTDDEAGTH